MFPIRKNKTPNLQGFSRRVHGQNAQIKSSGLFSEHVYRISKNISIKEVNKNEGETVLVGELLGIVDDSVAQPTKSDNPSISKEPELPIDDNQKNNDEISVTPIAKKIAEKDNLGLLQSVIEQNLDELFTKKEEEIGSENIRGIEKDLMLQVCQIQNM